MKKKTCDLYYKPNDRARAVGPNQAGKRKQKKIQNFFFISASTFTV